MATVPPTPPPPLPPAPAYADVPKKRLIIYSRSSLFYWWPVWAFGFIFAIWSQFSDNRMVIIPKESTIQKSDDGDWMVKINFPEGTDPKTQDEFMTRDSSPISEESKALESNLHVSRRAWMAPIYFLVLLLTIFITNVPLRGLWSVIVIGLIIIVAILFALFDVWDLIFQLIGNLHVYINMGGYLFVATAVFIVWATAFFIFDKRTYIAFTPGRMEVREEIGGASSYYDTRNMVFRKQRGDIFRHYVLGFGSGDLTAKPSDEEEIQIPNVLLVGPNLRKAQEFISTHKNVDTH